MRRPSFRVSVFVVPLAATLSACAAPPPSARMPRPSHASGLRGTWILTAADEIRPDGTRGPSYGSNPGGMLIVDDSGRYSLQIFRRDRARFAANDKRRGTAAEFADAILGLSTHTGRCFIDPADGALVFRIENSAYPNWEGTEQRREFTLRGDTLAYRIPRSASGNGTIPISEWVRLP